MAQIVTNTLLNMLGTVRFDNPFTDETRWDIDVVTNTRVTIDGRTAPGLVGSYSATSFIDIVERDGRNDFVREEFIFAGDNFTWRGESMTGGTMTAYYDGASDITSGREVKTYFYMLGFSAPIVDFVNAVVSRTAADDMALLRGALAGADRFVLSRLDDKARGFGGNDTMLGNGGNDLLLGEAGNDDLRGGQGSDVLRGGAGKDVLSGDGGNDTLQGNGGKDRMTGGAGADHFVFGSVADSRGASADVITDFRSGLDVIDLRAIDANTSQSGNQAFALATRAADHSVWFTAQNGGVFLNGDVNGDGVADLRVFLQGAGAPGVDSLLL